MKKITILKTSLTLGVLAGTVLLAGCAADFDNLKQGYSTNITGQAYPATQAQNVVLSYINEPNKPKICKDYTTIGQVSIQTYNAIGFNYSAGQLSTKLKDGGASLGANAVINISGSNGFGNGTMVGYAIHCKTA